MKIFRRRHQHQWFPSVVARQYVPMTAVCLAQGCSAIKIVKPWGTCLGWPEHGLAEHYTERGAIVAVGHCEGPQ